MNESRIDREEQKKIDSDSNQIQQPSSESILPPYTTVESTNSESTSSSSSLSSLSSSSSLLSSSSILDSTNSESIETISEPPSTDPFSIQQIQSDVKNLTLTKQIKQEVELPIINANQLQEEEGEVEAEEKKGVEFEEEDMNDQEIESSNSTITDETLKSNYVSAVPSSYQPRSRGMQEKILYALELLKDINTLDKSQDKEIELKRIKQQELINKYREMKKMKEETNQDLISQEGRQEEEEEEIEAENSPDFVSEVDGMNFDDSSSSNSLNPSAVHNDVVDDQIVAHIPVTSVDESLNLSVEEEAQLFADELLSTAHLNSQYQTNINQLNQDLTNNSLLNYPNHSISMNGQTEIYYSNYQQDDTQYDQISQRFYFDNNQSNSNLNKSNSLIHTDDDDVINDDIDLSDLAMVDYRNVHLTPNQERILAKQLAKQRRLRLALEEQIEQELIASLSSHKKQMEEGNQENRKPQTNNTSQNQSSTLNNNDQDDELENLSISSSHLITYVRFTFSIASIQAYKAAAASKHNNDGSTVIAHSDIDNTYESIEWLCADIEEEWRSVYSLSLRGRSHEKEVSVTIDSRKLVDGDIATPMAIQLWKHQVVPVKQSSASQQDSNDRINSHEKESEMLVQIVASIPELAAATDNHSKSKKNKKGDDKKELASFCERVEVFLMESQIRNKSGVGDVIDVGLVGEKKIKKKTPTKKSSSRNSLSPSHPTDTLPIHLASLIIPSEFINQIITPYYRLTVKAVDIPILRPIVVIFLSTQNVTTSPITTLSPHSFYHWITLNSSQTQTSLINSEFVNLHPPLESDLDLEVLLRLVDNSIGVVGECLTTIRYLLPNQSTWEGADNVTLVFPLANMNQQIKRLKSTKSVSGLGEGELQVTLQANNSNTRLHNNSQSQSNPSIDQLQSLNQRFYNFNPVDSLSDQWRSLSRQSAGREEDYENQEITPKKRGKGKR